MELAIENGGTKYIISYVESGKLKVSDKIKKMLGL